jgi:hypothetical protein
LIFIARCVILVDAYSKQAQAGKYPCHGLRRVCCKIITHAVFPFGARLNIEMKIEMKIENSQFAFQCA